jgi:hypothetical protein
VRVEGSDFSTAHTKWERDQCPSSCPKIATISSVVQIFLGST